MPIGRKDILDGEQNTSQGNGHREKYYVQDFHWATILYITLPATETQSTFDSDYQPKDYQRGRI